MKKCVLLAALLLAGCTTVTARKEMAPGMFGAIHKGVHHGERMATLESIRKSLASINVSAVVLAKALEAGDAVSDGKEATPPVESEEETASKGKSVSLDSAVEKESKGKGVSFGTTVTKK